MNDKQITDIINDILSTSCRLRHQQVKTKRRKNPHPHSNGYFVQCDRCIFYGSKNCEEYKINN